jgi:2-methylcitrate dehydratase PrpD
MEHATRKTNLSMIEFIDQLCEAVLSTEGGDAQSRALIGRGIADTVAVSAAGFPETVTRSTLAIFTGTGARTWSGATCESRETAVMINAIASHALDFDDVMLESLAHPNAVIVPSILHLGVKEDPDRIIAAAAAGLIAARAIGGRLTQAHYRRGWHGTGTVGVFAAAAAAGRLAGLNSQQMKWAFGLAAAQSGGLQKNFSTMAKPCQAGFAAAAGVRAARLAAANITSSDDIFGPNGYFDAYGEESARNWPKADFSLRPDCVSVKLYPCCYAASRLIGIALDARKDVGDAFSDPAVTVRLVVPDGSIDVLRFDRPVNGLEAKFSAPYTVSVALLDGAVTMQHFTQDAVERADIRNGIARVAISVDPAQPSEGKLENGVVRLEVFKRGDLLTSYSRHAIPGSPADSASIDQIRTKADACYAVFEKAFGFAAPMREEIGRMPDVAQWLSTTRISPF